MTVQALDIISFALKRMGVYAPGETIADSDAEDCLVILNDMLDSWSNESLACFTILEQSVALVAGKASYTIGSGGDVSGTRPLRLIKTAGSAYIQDTTGQNYPVEVVERDLWNLIGNRSGIVTSQVPDTLFYDPQFPLGLLNFWPTPNLA